MVVAIWLVSDCVGETLTATSLILAGDSRTSLQFAVLSCQLCEGFQVGYFEVGLGGGGFGCAAPGRGDGRFTQTVAIPRDRAGTTSW